jgi:hypothetical protein
MSPHARAGIDWRHGNVLSITLRVYAHLFDSAEHAERARSPLETEFGEFLRG